MPGQSARTTGVISAVFAASLVGLAGGHLLATRQAASYTLTIPAGEIARRDAWVRVSLPPGIPDGALQLRAPAGDIVALQRGSSGEAWAVLPALPAEKAVTYLVEAAATPAVADRVRVVQTGSQLALTVDGSPALSYVGEPVPLPAGVDEAFRRGGYIHPVSTPSGRRVTEDYPPNHRHHHGIWAAWTSTRYEGRAPDFWNMGDRKGRVEFEALGQTWSGPLTGGFETRHRYVDLLASPAKSVVAETWRVIAYAMPAAGGHVAHVFDLEIAQRMVGDTPLALPRYRYGGVGMRGRHEWDGPDKTHFVTSSGRTRLPGHGTRATWVHMSGEVDGQRAGLAMLSHPDNFRSPQPMRIHPTEPFFNFAPQQAGGFELRPGAPYVAKYRFIASDGPADAEWLDAMWQAYALPAVATVEAK